MTDAWVRFAGGDGAHELAAESAFVIGVIADLSARGERASPRERRALAFVDVDRDELDAIFARCAPQLELALPGAPPFLLRLTSFADLHPDALVARIPTLAALARARFLAQDERTLRRGLAEAGVALDGASLAPASEGAAAERAAGRVLLDELLGAEPSEGTRAASARRSDEPLATLVQAIGERAAGDANPAATAERRAALDQELTQRLRAVLGDARVRALEAAWRGLRGLARAAETGAALRIRVLDASRAEIAAAGNELDDVLRGVWGSDAPEPGHAPALLVGDFALSAAGDALAFGERLAAAAARAGARVVANAAPELVESAARGALASSAAWRAHRERCGNGLRLAGPRVLARLPYGVASDPIEAFRFEECAAPTEPRALCWGGGAFLVARAVAACVGATGALRDVAAFSQIEGLPQLASPSGSALGPAERVLRSDEREALVQSGLIAVCAAPGSDAVRLALGGGL